MKSIISFLILISVSCLRLDASGPSSLAEKQHRKTSLPLKEALNTLELARAETRNSQGPMIAAVLFSAGYALKEADVAKSKQYLEEAFQILQDADASLPGIKHLQEDLILQLTAVDPDFAESHLPGDPDFRELALQQLVAIRASKKQFERAISLLESMSSPEFALGNLMAALPKSDVADKERVFASALTSYKRQSHTILSGSSGDLGRVVVDYYKQLPPTLVLEAIQVLLDEADPRNAVEGSQIKKGTSVRAILPSGTLRFASYFEFRVFQLAPVLRELDSKSAEDLLKNDPTVSSLLSKFPNGEESIDRGSTQDATSGTSYVIGDQSMGLSSSDKTTINELLKRKESATVFAQIDQLNDPRLKSEALLKLSMACSETCSDQSETALEHLIFMRDKIDPRNADVWLRATNVALNLHKSEIANQLIDLAGKAGLNILQDDNNPDDPNLALKLYWPATMAWKNVIATAKKISTSKANQMLTLIPDPEIRAVERCFLAGYLLGMPVWNDESPLVVKKSLMVH